MCCAVLALQSCLTLFDPTNCSPQGSLVTGILQARIPELVAIPFSKGSSWPRGKNLISQVSCFGRQVLYPQRHLRSPSQSVYVSNLKSQVNEFHSGYSINKLKLRICNPVTFIYAETVTDIIFVGSNITADGDCSHAIKRPLLLEEKL